MITSLVPAVLADVVVWPIFVGLAAIIIVGIAVLVAVIVGVRLLVKRRRERMNAGSESN